MARERAQRPLDTVEAHEPRNVTVGAAGGFEKARVRPRRVSLADPTDRLEEIRLALPPPIREDDAGPGGRHGLAQKAADAQDHPRRRRKVIQRHGPLPSGQTSWLSIGTDSVPLGRADHPGGGGTVAVRAERVRSAEGRRRRHQDDGRRV